ncbi:MAG: DUF3344 domain-containing protein, partial [Methanophagales archaeon]|nr:DUF3344 domain-containing protein [Methanophagales archaeon]
MNTSESWEADSYADSNFFQTVISANEGDVLVFIATDGEKVNTTKYRITEEDNKRSGLFSLNLTLGKPPSGSVPDLTAVNISTDSKEPVRGDVLNITATIENRGNITANTTSVVFLDEKNISIQRNISKSTLNDTVSQPGALKIRVHFSYINIHGACSYIKIYNASDVLIYNFTTTDSLNITNFWTTWGTGAQIRIESHAADYINFTIDKYESVFANKALTLGPWQSKGIKAEWNASAWLNNDTDLASGNHIICVSVDPLDLVKESDETNNNMSMTVEVKSAVNKDLEVVNITLNKTTIFDGDIVNISATVKNKGTEDVSEFNVSFIDFLEDSNTSEELDEAIVSNLSAGDSITINASWEATLGNHTITVIADPYDKVRESNEKDNQKSKSVYVRAPYDFSITHISLSADPDNLFSDELVAINATLKIMNFVNRSGTVDVCLYLNETLLNTRNVEFNAGNATINESFEWRAGTAGNHALTVCVDPNNKLTESNESNNNMSVPITVQKGNDFAVTNLMFKPQNPVIGDIVKINATIANFGVENKSTVAELEFYDNKAIKIERTWDEHAGETTDDVLMLPDARKIRVHFSRIGVYSHIIICDKNGSVIEEFDSSFWEEHPDKDITDYWTKWCDGDTIRIVFHCARGAKFSVDQYEAVLANESFSLDAGKHTNRSAVLNLSMQEMGWALNGTHNITAMVDPYDDIDEPDEENNVNTTRITVTPSLDFAVTDIYFEPREPLLGDIVRINATVKNFGIRNGTTSVAFFYDNKTVSEISIINKSVMLNASESKNVTALWNATTLYGGAGPHNITVCIDRHDVFTENNETNNTLTRQIFVNGTDLAVTNIDIPCGFPPDEFCYHGQNVNITATIANFGAINASNFTVFFKDGISETTDDVNRSGIVFNKTTVQNLRSGENITLNVTWRPVESGIHTITVSIPFDNRDNNEMNNERWKIPEVSEPAWDFRVENVSVYPQEVREGEDVLIAATIGNHGHKSGNVSVGFFVNRTDFAGSEGERFERIGTKEVFVPVNDTNFAFFIWNTSIHGGDHLIVAVADPDEKLAEIKEYKKLGDSILFRGNKTVTGNNVKSCTLHVIGPDLAITNLTLDPEEPKSGDVVNITVEIKNSDSTTANSTVQFYMQSDESIHGRLKNQEYTQQKSWPLALQPADVPMRFHFDYIDLEYGSKIYAYVCDSDKKRHTVYFYVKSETAGGQEVKVSGIDFGTEGFECKNEPSPGYCIEKRWNDVWTEWTYGSASVVTAIANRRSSLEFLLDKYQVQLGNRTITLNANESGLYNTTWNTRFPLKPGKNYTILTTVENRTCSNETRLSGTDLAVTNISMKPVVYDGDLVWINATIANFGCLNASDFLVSFYEVFRPTSVPSRLKIRNYNPLPHYKLLNKTHIEALPAGNSINISFVPWNAGIRDIYCEALHDNGVDREHWWEPECSNYIINVTIEPLENPEHAKENNTLLWDVHVNRSRDFNVTNLSFFVNGTARNPHELELYDIVTTNATLNITNFANQPGMVNLSFYIDEVKPEHVIGSTTVRFDPSNGTGYANITWTADNLYRDVYIPGDHNITVVVDPEEEIYEINDSKLNNEFTWRIHVKAPELMFENLSIEPGTLKKDDKAIINVTIANRGGLNASDFNLTLYEWAERHIDNVMDNEQYKGFPEILIERANATAMRLYLDLEIEEYHDPEIEIVRGGEVCIKDGKGEVIRCYNHSFHGWTPWILDNKSVVETIKRMTINRYLFCWDNVPGSENESLLRFLTEEEVDWAENATINKTDDNRTIQIYAENNSANLTLDVQNETATLEIGGDIILSLIVKEENGKPKIYKRETQDIDIDTKVSKIYYFTQTHIIDTTTRNLTINETANIPVEWTFQRDGEQFIVAKIDPEEVIMEYNEMNNTFKQYMPVQTADLEVTNLSLTWLNGTEVRENDTVRDNDTVGISANVTNVGIEEASNFSVYFLVDDIPIKNETISGLANGSPILVNANWTAEVGKHVIKVEADYENKINETKETNNIEALVRYVCGAEVSGNTSWKTLGLRGLNGTILFDPTQPYDEDDVNITAIINNSGRVNATNFSVALLFDYKPSDSFHKAMNGVPINESETYNNAVCIYLYIDINPDYSPPVLVIKDKNNTEVARTSKSCWIHVPGDTVEIKQYNPNDFSPEYTISFYPVYRANLIRDENLTVNTNSSKNVSIRVRNVTVGDHSVLLFIDPEGNVPEDDKTDNIASRIMRVNATRDFTVTNVIAAKTNLSDTDTADITAEVANVGLRNGTANVSITDYETENRTYRYHFDKNLPVSYLPIAPNASLLKPEYDNLTIIHRPGVDSLQLHFERISLFESGKLLICNENGDKIFEKTGSYSREDYTILVPGDTAYIYNTSLATFLLSGYTAVNKLLYEENLQLNATKTWNESKDITVKNWLAATGNHRINVTVWNNTIKEINETNNTFILPLPVNASRDPTVVNITLDPEHPDDGEDVNITATVRNNGTKPATFTVDLWRNTTRLISQSELPEIGLLNHTQVTLAPGENATVTGVWKNISLYSAPTHVVTAIVDPLDEIDEINETQSDNELNKYLWMNYPDFTITKFNQPARKDKNTSVEITNQGALDASNVTVRLELGRYNPYPLAGSGFGYYKISHPGAADLRLHFINIDASQGWLGIQRNPGDKEVIMEYCKGIVSDVWTPLIEGDTVYIISFGSSFLIDEYRWGDVEYKTIDRLNVSESKNISLPLRWGKYERPTFLNVSVDPYDNITELNEYNNNRTAYIYADLVLRDVGTVFSEDGNLSSINATIWSNNRLEDGIAFPVCNFSVALIDRDSNEVLLTEQIYKNDTVYGGEEREVLFTVSEIMSKSERENRTSHFDVVVDFEKEIREINETNNNKTIDIGPDIVVGEIYTESLNDSSSCECIVGAVIRNEGNFRAENFSVRLHLNSTTGNINETVYENIPCLVPWGEHNETKLLFREDRVKVAPNHIYELVEVVADPENTVEELDEGNNENETEIGPDIVVERFEVPRYLIANHSADILVRLNNTGEVGAKGFNITLSPSMAYTNRPLLDDITHQVSCLKPNGETLPYVFNWTVPAAEGVYNFTLRADPEDDVEERDETNNNGSAFLKRAFADIGYRGDKLEPYKTNKTVEGDVIFKLYTRWKTLEPNNNNTYSANWNVQIPDGAMIEIARLYVYWGWSWRRSASGDVPACPNITMEFNGQTITQSGNYTDYPVNATASYGRNYAYGTYCYNVLPIGIVRNGTNTATLTLNQGVNETGFQGMGLLVVYRGGDETYTRYWIDEGADMLIGGPTPTGHYTPLC